LHYPERELREYDMAAIVAIVGIFVAIAAFGSLGLGGTITLVAGGGIGFAIGSIFNFGWSIFGAVIGGLIGAYVAQQVKGRA
jgi:hypothetical protein